MIQKCRTDHLQIFTEYAPEGMSKTAALCAAVLELFMTLDRGDEFFASSPVICGLTWSDSSLAERAALQPCKPRPLGLAMADEDGIVSVSKPTDGILHIILPSV